MKKSLLILFLALMVPLTLSQGTSAWAESYQQEYYQTGADLLMPDELDELLAPIALYPDPLIAQILPAATFVDQIDDAARFVRRYGPSRVDYQRWDLSVRAIAHYPQVIYMMDRNLDWTASLGQAFIEQPQEVMDAIQRLRDDARAAGNLYSTSQQLVIVEAGIIRIVPARPQYVYLPVYDPYVVYYEPYSPSYPFITFSVGFTIGAWLNRDCDWRRHRVYYHGWRGTGWVSRSRPHIHDRRGIYINQRASSITVNTRVAQRDTRVYRRELRNEGLRWRGRTGGRSEPARVQTRRGTATPGARIEQPRPGRVEQRRREQTPQPGPGRVEPRRQIQAPQLTPGRVKQQRPGRTESAPSGRTQPRPGIREGAPSGENQQHRPSRIEQHKAPAVQQSPAATGRQPAGTEQKVRRRQLRQINRPPATPATEVPRATVPAPNTATPPTRVTPPPAAKPPVVPAPASPAAPREIETPRPSRPEREQGEGSGRGGRGGGERAEPRGGGQREGR